MSTADVSQQVREVIKKHAHLGVDVSTLADNADLYNAGMTSHASVNLMLALEEQFDVEFPERVLRRRTFESIQAIGTVVTELMRERAT